MAADAAPAAMVASWSRVFLPFALGYYLSYLLRTVNAVISPALTAELQLGAAHLGLLTSTYFLAFGAAQIPVGIALDRYGPRRVEAALLLLTALGSVLFALGEGFGMLAGARALIGVGVSACLMGALKGFAMWYPPERQTSMTGFIMAAGALGALTATAPVEAMLPLFGWRGVFWLIAAVALGIAIAIMLALPDQAPQAARESIGSALRSVGSIFVAPGFLRYAASSTFFTGGFMAIQSLWAVPWLMHGNGFDLPQAARTLMVLNVGMLSGQLAIGVLGTRLARLGVRPANLMQMGFAGMLVVELAVVLQLGPVSLLWFLIGVLSAVNSQSYLASASHFPRPLFARVSTAINLMAFAGAFLVQWGLGVALDLLLDGGHDMGEALALAFGGLIALQAVAYVPLLPMFGRAVGVRPG